MIATTDAKSINAEKENEAESLLRISDIKMVFGEIMRKTAAVITAAVMLCRHFPNM